MDLREYGRDNVGVCLLHILALVCGESGRYSGNKASSVASVETEREGECAGRSTSGERESASLCTRDEELSLWMWRFQNSGSG